METEQARELILDFKAVRRHDISSVGGKVASLGELIHLKLPVPPGFAITAEAYRLFVDQSHLKTKISDLLDKLDVNDIDSVAKASKEIRAIIEEESLPKDIRNQAIVAYKDLGEKLGVDDPEVAVRSSATAEDLPTASFAGQQETYLFITGVDDMLNAVKKCFSSLFTPRAIVYRIENEFDHTSISLSVGVQRMLNSKSSGVIFTLNPIDGNQNVVVIESSWGVGETIVQGHVVPDRFVVKKHPLQIEERQIATKRLMTIRRPEEEPDSRMSEIEVPQDIESSPSISDKQVLELAKYALQIEAHYQRAVDIEWASDRETGRIHILQARPETVWSDRMEAIEKADVKRITAYKDTVVLVRGLGASPGTASGKVQVIRDVKEIGGFESGNILVTEMTSPDWVPAMRKAAAIVTDSGGMTAHAAIVARELGIPCIVGTNDATTILKTGVMVTINGSLGAVHEGVMEEKHKEKLPSPAALAAAAPVTATKLYMNLGQPGKIDEYHDLPFDGIGLMRVEFIIADEIREHPLYMIENKREAIFIDKLAEGISKVARAIYPRPIIVRFSDFKTNEYRSLKGGEKFEPQENNPMIGWRGVSRYASPEFEPGFRLECRAIKKVRDEMGLKNVWVMLPFVRTTWEVQKTEKIMAEEGLERNRDFQLWLMVEVPSQIILADEFSKLCDGFSIGSNDLTQLTLGADRDSGVLGGLGYFDERDPAVLRSIAHLIKVAHKNDLTVSICGQAPSVYPELTTFLIENGIDSISVNPDAIAETRKLMAGVERRVLLDKATGHTRDSKNGDFSPEWSSSEQGSKKSD